MNLFSKFKLWFGLSYSWLSVGCKHANELLSDINSIKDVLVFRDNINSIYESSSDHWTIIEFNKMCDDKIYSLKSQFI